MKIIRLIFFTIIVMIFVMLLPSCEKSGDEIYFNEPVIGGSYAVYNGVVYHRDHSLTNSDILTINLENGDVGSLCYDPLCEHKDENCPLSMGRLTSVEAIAIDSSKPDRLVFYMTVLALDNMHLIKYDPKTGEKTVLIQDWELGNIQTPVLWGKYIYFWNSAATEDGSSEIYRMNGDGADLECVYKISSAIMDFIDFSDGYLYFYDTGTKDIFRANNDFSVVERVDLPNIDESGIYAVSRIHNGYLYYRIAEEAYAVSDDYCCPYYDFEALEYKTERIERDVTQYRIKLGEPDAEPEFVAAKVGGNTYIQDDLLVWIRQEHNHVGYHMQTNRNGEEHKVFDFSPYSTLRIVDSNTLEEEIIFEKALYSVLTVYKITEDHVIFYGNDMKKESETQKSESNIYRYDRNAKTFEQLY